jgi:hypothetical protein
VEGGEDDSVIVDVEKEAASGTEREEKARADEGEEGLV